MDEKFTFVTLTTPEQLRQAYELRFQVYCRECQFIKESDYPQGFETDEFDAHSVHFGAVDEKGALVGCARMILPTCQKFPIEEHCAVLNVDRNNVARERSIEISRLTISKLFRRRSDDGLYYGPNVSDRVPVGGAGQFMQRVRPMAFGLYRALYQECKKRGITHWYALMEPTLWMLLKIHGFVFNPIGSSVDFYGLVTPYLASIADLEKSVHHKFPQFYRYFIENLTPELVPRWDDELKV